MGAGLKKAVEEALPSELSLEMEAAVLLLEE